MLSLPLQTGVERKAQVWLAEPQAQDCDVTDHGETQVLFKFIAPSHRDAKIPIIPMDEDGVMRLAHYRYEHPFTIATRAVAACDALLEFQGSTVPYMHGVFEMRYAWLMRICVRKDDNFLLTSLLSDNALEGAGNGC